MKIKSEEINEFKVNIIDTSSHIKEEVNIIYDKDGIVNMKTENSSKRKVSLDNLHKKK